jgi:glycosyltransferase involved in cell wall biosynthesis
MRILVIAYEYPPSPSPQSLRWMYLSRELASMGHSVDVLTADVPEPRNGLGVPAGVMVHRTFAGPVRGLLAALVKRKRRQEITAAIPTAGTSPGNETIPVGLNWKGRLVEQFQSIAEHFTYPDLRGEWKWAARRRLHQLLAEMRPDWVISSHEPATTLELGILAERAGFRWMADMGDPVLAAYTPKRWRTRSMRLEAAVCRRADALVVTNYQVLSLLQARHGHVPRNIVLTQGFDDRREMQDETGRSTGAFELLYTGSFYGFRKPDVLLQAVAACPGTRLSIASVRVPNVVKEYSQRYPDRIRLLGFLPHEHVLRLQRESDVLVNIGNEDPCQIPGKLFEYMGARRPILHISMDPDTDEAAKIVEDAACGWVVPNDEEALTSLFRALQADADAAWPESRRVDNYGWSRIAEKLADFLQVTANE